jgi:DNA (cytosine-5)-methyltransferase 1
MNYYNENNPDAAAWLRELIRADHIAPGFVDERSIVDVKADKLGQYTQCHFFAGIGGWPLALRLAGWPDERRAWTGSCPCQPFSQIGKRQLDKDARNLWPALRGAIKIGKPTIVFGEQVASKDGRIWLSGIRTDLEAMGYEVGAADLCAAGVSAPHMRQRLYWMANCIVSGLEGHSRNGNGRRESGWDETKASGPTSEGGGTHRMGNPESGEQRRSRQCVEVGRRNEPAGRSSPWDNYQPVECRDGKTRRIPIEPALFPLAPRIPGHVELLRGAGNAIVPQLAATFVQACDEVISANEKLRHDV